MNIREFLDKVEEVALNSMEVVEDHVESLRDKFEAKQRMERIKENSKGRRRKPQKRLRRR